MFDPLSLAVGGALLILGWIGGRISLRPRTPEQAVPNAICGCGHGIEHHDPDTQRCHDHALFPNMTGKNGVNLGDQWVKCTCRNYSGPRPIQELLAEQLPGFRPFE